MKRYPPARFRVVQEKPAGHVQFQRRCWEIWEWNDHFCEYEYYMFALSRARAFALIAEVMRRRRIRAIPKSWEVPC